MDGDARPRQVLYAAITRLLRPLIRVLLRNSVPFAAFEVFAKQVYVDVALSDFSIPGKKASVSRVSILTGLTRKEVQRLVARPAENHEEPAERYNRAARVLTAWARDPEFLDASSAPKALEAVGEQSFATLARRYSGDMPTRAVLDELLRVGAVRQRDDGLIEPTASGYIPSRSETDKVRILGTDVADLIATIGHNIEHGTADPRFQRKVMYDSIPVSALPDFRRFSAVHSQAMLEKFDRWLAARDTDIPDDEHGAARVGIGIYYFEEALGPLRPKATDE
jgi:hypothetical protein